MLLAGRPPGVSHRETSLTPTTNESIVTIMKKNIEPYVDSALQASVTRGLEDSVAGRVSDLGDFTKYTDEDVPVED